MVTLSRKNQRSTLSLLTIIRTSIGVAAVLILAWYNFSTSDDDASIAVLSRFETVNNAETASNGPPPVERHNQKIVERHNQENVPVKEFPVAKAPLPVVVAKPSKAVVSSATTTISKKQQPKATIAYAWTLAKCNDFQSSTEGMIDAALILKHSIHQVSSRVGKSQYDYHMYVLVHPDASNCTQILEDAGYTVKIMPQPVDEKNIRGEFLRKNVKREWCCGAKEFIKLYCYTLFEHPIVVHVDIDFAFFQPMDELFDAMLDGGGSPRRNEIVTQYPDREWPKGDIEAFITRDYQQIIPGDKRPLFQAGFMVVKPNQAVFDELVEVILEGNFVEGWKSSSGWGGLGYSGKVGAKAMQGLMAYYYDVLRPGVSVELHGCHYNWMGGDILYRDVPRFNPKQFPQLIGKCRNGEEECEDCQKAPISQIRSVHYTNCRKPWNCIGIKWAKGQGKTAQGIDERNTNYDKCLEVIDLWHRLRTEMEDKVIELTGNQTLVELWRGGDFKKETFNGHCTENGQKGYIPLSGGVSSKLFQDIYN